VSPLSQAGVDHLKNMKRLHSLDILEIRNLKHRRRIPDFIITVAGEVSSLQNFDFKAGRNQNQFIEDFGEKYPQKELVVNNLM
jgi:hypothetical protein